MQKERERDTYREKEKDRDNKHKCLRNLLSLETKIIALAIRTPCNRVYNYANGERERDTKRKEDIPSTYACGIC